jgi:3-oxoacyl-ACP reductase-like protein
MPCGKSVADNLLSATRDHGFQHGQVARHVLGAWVARSGRGTKVQLWLQRHALTFGWLSRGGALAVLNDEFNSMTAHTLGWGLGVGQGGCQVGSKGYLPNR